MSLKSLVQEWWSGGYTSNPERQRTRLVVVTPAAWDSFLNWYQARGGDMARYSEDEWRDMLATEFDVPEEYQPDYLESLAGWGVVDDALWYPEEGEGG